MDFLRWIILFFTCVIAEQKQPLNNFISHYEGLSYNTQTIHNNHVRNKRSLDPTKSAVRVKFNAHGRTFQLRLERDTSTFLPDAESVEADGSTKPLDVSHIYKGILEGEPSSYVHGSIINGVFSGRIETERSGTFYVDKSELYFSQMMPFHSVIYHDTHVIHPRSTRDKRSAEGSPSNDDSREMKDDDDDDDDGDDMPRVGCGLSNSDVHKWMEQVQNSAVPTTAEKIKTPSNPYHDFQSRYRPQTSKESSSKSSKKKRSSNGSNQNRMCALFLQSDPMLWDYMTRSPSEKTGGLGYSHERAREEITSLFASHVDGIKKIYSNTIFKYQDVGPFTGFTFAVHRVQINSSSECELPNDNPFCKSNVDVSNFLNLNSLSNHDLYCLAYVFTYRDFSQGTLGLAWVGSYLRSSGGLCERWKQYTENQRMIYKSLNTGIVTLVNYGSRVPPKVSTLTFAHEVGHNFGSPHDGGETCVPSLNNPNNLNGNFIMFASATSGDKPNNHEFSTCSIGNITLVLDAVLNEQNGKDNCFTQNQEAFCGNRIVEGDEECDCGFSTDCRNEMHSDHCCYEQESPKHCKRKENATCSPSEGPCCTGPRCSFTPLTPQVVCLQEKECSQVSYCTGLSAKCPSPNPKPDFTLCNSKTQICKKGDCAGSVCEKVNWTMCSMEAPTDDKSFDRGQLCYVSCLNPKTGKCISTGNVKDVYKMENKKLLELLEVVDMMDTGIRLPAGAPCDNYRGYCDVFQKCRAVNEDGPLARLMNIVFNKQTISDIKTWIVKNWWAVGLMFLGLIVFMAMFIKCCAVHTPSSNPRQPPARKLTLPRRHIQRPQPINPSTHIPLGPPPPYTPTPNHARIQPQQGKRRTPASSSRRNQGRPDAGRSRPNHGRYDIEIKHHRGRNS